MESSGWREVKLDIELALLDFRSTKVQILTLKALQAAGVEAAGGRAEARYRVK